MHVVMFVSIVAQARLLMMEGCRVNWDVSGLFTGSLSIPALDLQMSGSLSSAYKEWPHLSSSGILCPAQSALGQLSPAQSHLLQLLSVWLWSAITENGEPQHLPLPNSQKVTLDELSSANLSSILNRRGALVPSWSQNQS